MSKLLTISIPTYNRAPLLDRQLAWLARTIKGFESNCEIIISDNCSTDDTPDVIQKWEPELSGVDLKLTRQSQNIGAVRNITYCLNSAMGDHVWVVSDDDKIGDKALSYVINVLDDQPDLALLILNFSSHEMKTGRLRYERCFQIDQEEVNPEGKAVFEYCLQGKDPGGVALTTALIYRTDLVQQALKAWPSGLDNLAVQMYWTGYCAFHGSAKASRDVYLDCLAGTHHFMEDLRQYFRFRLADMPEVYVKLMDLGYSANLYRKMVLRQAKEVKTVFAYRRTLKFAWQYPGVAFNIFSSYLNSVLRTHLGLFRTAPTGSPQGK